MTKACCDTGDNATALPPGTVITIGVVGNPNCGKTTLFNALTGARQYVGNWPGVTVERKEGRYKDGDITVRVIDLPGVYTLGVVPGLEEESLDEKLARNNILADDIDVVVNIVDAGNLERNLYLTAQLLELRRPTVVALNMMDSARRQGITVDIAELSTRLGCPVVETVASRDEGIDGLKQAIGAMARKPHRPGAEILYPTLLERLAADFAIEERDCAKKAGVDPRWLAIRLIEGDDLAEAIADPARRDARRARIAEVEAELGEDADILVADGRFSFANHISQASTSRAGQIERSASDAVDRVVLNRFAGPLIFLAIIYLMFTFTINFGGAFVDFFDGLAGTVLVDGTRAVIAALGLPNWLGVILGNGVGGGIQTVATFVPIIGFLYLFMAFLENSGYMARAAFLMDRLMRTVGLPGKAFVPLIVGFGCNVPGIMASRTLDKERDRIMSVLMTPFMSCGARLTVYALFAAAFFPTGGQNVVFALYLIGILAAVATGFLLRHTLLKGETTPFIMELPPYRLPRPRDALIQAWIRLKGFVFGAGKIIVVVVMCLSVLNSIGTDGSFGNEDSEQSVLSEIGRAIVPAFRPIGLTEDNWPAAVGIFTGVFAKEAVVGTLDALYSGIDAVEATTATPVEKPPFSLLGGIADAFATIPANFAGVGDFFTDPLGMGIVRSNGDIEAAASAQDVSSSTFGAMQKRFDGGAGAFAYLLFVLLYFPCAAALGAIAGEIGNRWATFAALWTTGFAYFGSTLFYQLATFSAHPASSMAWVGGMVAAVAVAVAIMRRLGGRGSHPTIQPAE
ncbi:MAG: Fe(2+) transporter permease subunit FeoB [Hyphomicrobiales bacterium]